MSGRIHKGQRVRVVVPRAVLRVGYPKTLDDYRGAWPEGLLDFVRVAADKCDAMAGTTDGREMTHALVGAVDTALAKKRARDDGYGGPARTVHTVEHVDLAGAEGVVLALRTAYEGEYRASRGAVCRPWRGARCLAAGVDEASGSEAVSRPDRRTRHLHLDEGE